MEKIKRKNISTIQLSMDSKPTSITTAPARDVHGDITHWEVHVSLKEACEIIVHIWDREENREKGK